MPYSRILVTVLLAAFAFPAICQKPQFEDIKQIPDFVIYDSFFYRVAWLDNHANSLSAQGKNDTSTRSAIRMQANLTSTEEAALKAIAADLRVKDDGIVSATRALVAAGAQSGNPQQLQDLRNQRQQTITDHIAQLRAALGTTRFWELDAFIRRTSTVRRFAVMPPSR
jgi:hypothetical protein